jgi:hypothetical protein
MNNHHRLWTTLSLATIAAAFGVSAAQAQSLKPPGIDLGDASVLSQQGQRLKLAVPYGAEPGEKFPLLRFEVESVQVPEGHRAPNARSFTISKPESRNIIFLQSAENITAPSMKLVVAVAGNPGKRVEYDIAVPPASSTIPVVAEMAKPPIKIGKRKTKSKKSYVQARRSAMKRR